MAKLSHLQDNEVPVGTGFFDIEPAPPGKYLVVCSKNKDTVENYVTQANGSKICTSQMVYYRFTIMAGEHVGKIIFEHLGLVHTSEKYQQNSIAKLNSYFIAAGLGAINGGSDSDDLWGKPLVLQLKVTPGGPDAKDPTKIYGPKNEIVGAFPADSYQPTAPATPPVVSKNRPLTFDEPLASAIIKDEFVDDDDIPF